MAITNIRRILVPTDMSECSDRAVAYAAELAADLSAEVVLVHIIRKGGYPAETALASRHFPNLKDEMQKASEQHLDGLAEKYGSVIGAKLVEYGTPYAAILRAAEREKADLIVIGTHGHGVIAQAVLGSTAERVVRQASVPVITIK